MAIFKRKINVYSEKTEKEFKRYLDAYIEALEKDVAEDEIIQGVHFGYDDFEIYTNILERDREALETFKEFKKFMFFD